LKVPLPTVPMPNRPTLIGFIHFSLTFRPAIPGIS
jgi:hypothetical protein